MSENKYGLDVDYFSKKLSLIVRDIRFYTPEELSRCLIDLAKVTNADESTIKQAMEDK